MVVASEMMSQWRHKVKPSTEIPHFFGLSEPSFRARPRNRKTNNILQPPGVVSNKLRWYGMLFKDFKYASLRCSRQTGHGHIIFCDVTVMSFYKGLTPKFYHNIHNTYIQVCVCQVSFLYVLALWRYCEKENGGKHMPPAAGGWREVPAAATRLKIMFFSTNLNVLAYLSPELRKPLFLV